MYFFAVCDNRISLEPYIIPNSSCSGSGLDVRTKIVSTNGSCLRETCTVITTIMLDRSNNWLDNTFGSIYLTCTEDGWFPPKPKVQQCHKGKITFTLYFIASFFTTCIEHLMKIFFQIIEQ